VLNQSPIAGWTDGYLTRPSYFASFDSFKDLRYDKIRDPRLRYASVKWMGIWRNMSGGMGGVHPGHHMTELKDHLMRRTTFRAEGIDKPGVEQDAMIVKPDPASSKAFYEAMIGDSVKSGFDFLKVDFQTYNFWMYADTGNAVNSAHYNNQALETACHEHNLALLNCISQCNVNVFNTRHSVIARASVDVKLDNDNMARTVQSFANNRWWGDILVGDLDMYHTSNAKTAQYLTIARAISAGPVYISDLPLPRESDERENLQPGSGQPGMGGDRTRRQIPRRLHLHDRAQVGKIH
jgi:hypothetical protein